jgi:hypothetical protein
MSMPMRAPVALLAVMLLAGCQEDDERSAERTTPVRQVEGSLNLERSQAGPPDAGTRGGHGADRYLLRAGGATATVTGTVKPASAAIELVDEAGARVARVNVAPGGRFAAALPDLPRRGSVTFRLTARSGSAEPWETEIVASRRPAGDRPRSAPDVRVPARDRTPPAAILLLRSGGGVISSTAPVRADRDPPIRLAGPSLRLTALIRDRDGGTGRIRASLTYRQFCPDPAGGWRSVAPRVHHFPPAEIARVRLPPGTVAPGERQRRARVRLEHHPGCVARGKTWADATNASGLESFSDQIPFELGGAIRSRERRVLPPRAQSSPG